MYMIAVQGVGEEKPFMLSNVCRTPMGRVYPLPGWGLFGNLGTKQGLGGGGRFCYSVVKGEVRS